MEIKEDDILYWVYPSFMWTYNNNKTPLYTSRKVYYFFKFQGCWNALKCIECDLLGKEYFNLKFWYKIWAIDII